MEKLDFKLLNLLRFEETSFTYKNEKEEIISTLEYYYEEVYIQNLKNNIRKNKIWFYNENTEIFSLKRSRLHFLSIETFDFKNKNYIDLFMYWNFKVQKMILKKAGSNSYSNDALYNIEYINIIRNNIINSK